MFFFVLIVSLIIVTPQIGYAKNPPRTPPFLPFPSRFFRNKDIFFFLLYYFLVNKIPPPFHDFEFIQNLSFLFILLSRGGVKLVFLFSRPSFIPPLQPTPQVFFYHCCLLNFSGGFVFIYTPVVTMPVCFSYLYPFVNPPITSLFCPTITPNKLSTFTPFNLPFFSISCTVCLLSPLIDSGHLPPGQGPKCPMFFFAQLVVQNLYLIPSPIPGVHKT